MALLFLDNGAEVNFPCKTNGNTPVMWAAYRNNTEMLELLLEHGADPEIVNHDGFNALDVA